MPYVECPSCRHTTYSAAAYNMLELCPHCGAGLPLRRRVVSALAAQARRSRAAEPPTADPVRPATA